MHFTKGIAIAETVLSLAAPVSGENPFGADINYDTDFIACKTEFGKLGDIDYSLIESACVKLLIEKSKDLRLFGFLSFTYLKNGQWQHFSNAFNALSQLAGKSFTNLYPQREQAKINAIKWFGEPRFHDMLQTQKPDEQDYEHVCRFSVSLVLLQKILHEQYPGNSPFPDSLLTTAHKWESFCKPKPKSDTLATTSSVSPNSAETMETPKQAQTSIRKAAGFLVEHEPQRIMGYRIMRAIRWDIIEKLPASDNNKTQLCAPPAELVAGIATMLANKEYKLVLDKAESAFASGTNHLWLNLQRMSALACEGLGEPYNAVHSVLIAETALLLQRLPMLTELTFVDGTPFCDAQTKEWIKTRVMSQSTDSKTTSENPSHILDKEKQEAASLFTAGKAEDAIALLQNAIRNSATERDNFILSLSLCSLLNNAKHPDISLAILDTLTGKATLFNLDKWDTDLVVDMLLLRIETIKLARQGKPPPQQTVLTDKLSTAINMIYQLNPHKAFLFHSTF